ncbi:hypothetical protein ACY2DA_12975 [Staphylococcus simulans]
MLTKEFAQRVELSEKQVRKIVQHLEERGYHLKKTEYRGREATDFQEEDIELFREIADKVKQTNSYDLAFEELEKENDFLQIVVKDDQQEQLPSDQNFAKLLSDLHNDITKMREERQMLGQMISQVHQQQKDLQTLQQQMTDKLDQHEKTLKAIETAQKDQAKAVQDNTEAMKSHTEKVLAQPEPTVEPKTESKAEEEVRQNTEAKDTTPSTDEDKTETPLSDYKGATASTETKQEQTTQTESVKSESTSEQPSDESSKTTESENETPESEVQGTPNTVTPEPEMPIDNQHEPTVPHHKKEEKKGFFARLFGM